ncbi:chloride channel protein [Myroides sp. LJL119]
MKNIFSHFLNFIKLLFRYLEGILFFIKSITTERQYLYISCIIVGASSGVAVVILKTFAESILKFATHVQGISSIPFSFSLLPIVGIILTVFVIKKFFNGTLEKGTTEIMISIAKKAGIIPKKQMYAQILTSSLTVGFGGSLGLESPTAITGAAFGSNYAQNYLLPYKDRIILLASGVAAGISAMYNAPIGGIFYAVEIILLEVSISSFIPIMIASVTGNLVANSIKDEGLLLFVKQQFEFNANQIPIYILLGVAIGFFSVYHARMFRFTMRKLNSYVNHPYKKAIIGGGILGLLILVFPSLFGEGYGSVRMLISDSPQQILHKTILEHLSSNSWVLLVFVIAAGFIKTFAVGLTLGSGGNGGDFGPALFVGSYMGFAFGKLLTLIGLSNVPVQGFAVVGMAGVITALFHSPLTAIFLIVEVTSSYALLPPMLIVVAISYAISKKLENYSMDLKEVVPTGMVFTTDKDANILNTINPISYLKNDYRVLSDQASIQQVVEIFSTTSQVFIPLVDSEQKVVGVISLAKSRTLLFNSADLEKTPLSSIISPATVLTYNDSAKTFVDTFDQNHLLFILVEQDNKYAGYVEKNDIMDAYRQNLKTLWIG